MRSILRWDWWRINAWSEIAAMTAAATISLTLESTLGMPAVRALHAIDPALGLVAHQRLVGDRRHDRGGHNLAHPRKHARHARSPRAPCDRSCAGTGGASTPGRRSPP